MPEGKAAETIEENKVQAGGGGGADDRIARLERENSDLLKETLSKKEQIRTMEGAKVLEQENLLKEQNKYKELYEGANAKAKRAEELEPIFTTLLDAEIALIPEGKRDMVPAFEKPEQKLLWLQKAKTMGFFNAVETNGKKTTVTSVQSKVSTDGTLPEYLSYDRNDPRIAQLPISEYQAWKRHNTKTTHGVRGWGNSQ